MARIVHVLCLLDGDMEYEIVIGNDDFFCFFFFPSTILYILLGHFGYE